MNTEQNYAPNGKATTHSVQTAPSAAQTPSIADNRQHTTPPANPFTQSQVSLSLSVREYQGNMSEVELVYWGLEALKVNYLELLTTKNKDDSEYREDRHHLSKAQDIQNGLFGLVAGLASQYAGGGSRLSQQLDESDESDEDDE